MFYYSLSRHLFDTMFAIFCVIAGASSHILSNTSRTVATNQIPNRQKTSFIDFLLDAEADRVQSTTEVNYAESFEATVLKSNRSSSQNDQILNSGINDLCSLLTSILSPTQIKFCHRHQDILGVVLPEVLDLSRTQCVKITSDLKWNCPLIEPLLDRSKYLAFTKEAALVRSILNASMMYLILKSCSANAHRSCGCKANQNPMDFMMQNKIEGEVEKQATGIPIGSVTFSQTDLHLLHTGSPLRLSRARYQGCLANVAFADALTRVFLDTDDNRSLDKAYKVLNEEMSNAKIPSKPSSERRQIDTDYKDLSIIRWTKSAVNLHNNNFGRKVVREAIKKQCRCHGLSGACQYQTCWDKLLGFEFISTRLKSAYLFDATQVEVKNLGNIERPDLYLVKPNRSDRSRSSIQTDSDVGVLRSDISLEDGSNQVPVRFDEILYLYDAPNYCDPQPMLSHAGTRGRFCKPLNRSEAHTSRKKSDVNERLSQYDQANINDIGSSGTCEELCCNRGYHNNLVLTAAQCNCKFKFCCQVECDICLRQQLFHYCS